MLLNSNEYIEILGEIKNRIKTAQYKAILSANRELILLYWNIGNVINSNSSWGNKFVVNLARDIKLDFPTSSGYSVRNLKYMSKFAAEYRDEEFVQQVVAQLPWGHNLVLLDKTKDEYERKWYIKNDGCHK